MSKNLYIDLHVIQTLPPMIQAAPRQRFMVV